MYTYIYVFIIDTDRIYSSFKSVQIHRGQSAYILEKQSSIFKRISGDKFTRAVVNVEITSTIYNI